MSLIAKLILLELASSLSAPVADNTMHYPFKFKFYFTINPWYFEWSPKITSIYLMTHFDWLLVFKIKLASFASVFPNNIALYLECLKLSIFPILAVKLLASSWKQNLKIPEKFKPCSLKLYTVTTKSNLQHDLLLLHQFLWNN